MTTNEQLATIDDLTIRFERVLAAPLARAWRAVTDEAEMRSWFPSHVAGERKVGAPLAFPFDDNVADTFEGEVVTWEPEREFAFTWNGDLLRIVLEPIGDDATRLVFTQVLFDRTEAPRTSAGWHFCLANLDAHLGGPPADPETWRSMFPRYLERMGPPLGVPNVDGSMTWTRSHFSDPRAVEAAFAELHQGTVAITTARDGHRTTFTVTHPTAGKDPSEAARWHRLLIELDMRLSTGQPFAVEHDFTADYENLLA